MFVKAKHGKKGDMTNIEMRIGFTFKPLTHLVEIWCFDIFRQKNLEIMLIIRGNTILDTLLPGSCLDKNGRIFFIYVSNYRSKVHTKIGEKKQHMKHMKDITEN